MAWEKQEGAGIWLPKDEGEELVGIITGEQAGDYGKTGTDYIRAQLPESNGLSRRKMTKRY